MRFYFGWLAFISMAIYAWRNFLLPLCFLIASMAVIERPDFPKSAIPGLSAWNLLYVSLIAAFFFKHSKGEYQAELPKDIKRYLWFYLFFILLAFIRETADFQGINEFRDYVTNYKGGVPYVTLTELFINDVFNTIKYAVPGVLCFFAAKDRHSIFRILQAIIVLNVVLALLVIKVMPIGLLADGYLLEQTGIRKIDRDIGYFRTDIAILFAGSAWVVYIYRGFCKRWAMRQACMAAVFAIVLAMALTGGRIGMGAWMVVGTVIAFLKWRGLAVFGVIITFVVVSLVPAVQERFLQGLVVDENASTEGVDLQSATSGRVKIWPYVIQQIGEKPFFGNGRRAMLRIGLSRQLGEEFGLPFQHPHNAYLQLLLDNGLLLSIPLLIFYLLLLKRSFSLLRDARNNMYVLCGGCAFSLLLAQLVGFLGSQSFYPFTSSVSLWCSMGVMIRVHQTREATQKARFDHSTLYPEANK